MTPQHIIIHHSLTKDSGTVSWKAIRMHHMAELGWKAIGYHYGIERINGDYEILKGRMDNETGAHCRQEGMNKKSLGICCVGNFDLHAPDMVIKYKLITLVRSLMKIYSIPIENVSPHSKYATYKTCPGSKFDFPKFLKGLKEGLYE
jgi:N-acetylmuramoyl-L-alanine amidase